MLTSSVKEMVLKELACARDDLPRPDVVIQDVKTVAAFRNLGGESA